MKTAKLFKNGQSQAVRLPREFRMPGTEVNIQRVGHSLVLTPTNENPFAEMFEAARLFSPDFMTEGRAPQTDTERDSLDD